MTAKEIFEKYTMDCIPAVTPMKQYGQLLRTIHFNLSMFGQEEEFFTLLEKAEKDGKKLAIDMPEDILYNEFDISAIVLV